jgi:DNA-binding beta-propeller fold protein YncE
MKLVALPLLCAVVVSIPAAELATLKLNQTIPLPDVKGRFDHFAIDTAGRRLFVAALGNNTLEVLDVAAGRRLQSIPGLRKPTGVVYLPDKNQMGVANGDDGTFKVFDGRSYQLTTSLEGLDDADNVRWDARRKRIYLGYGDGAVAGIDAGAVRPDGVVRLAAHPESFQLETNGSRIFVNVPGANQIAVIDRDRRTVTDRWPLGNFRANFPMALEESNHRLFVGCRQPARLLVLDTATGKRVADLAIAGDTDDLYYDPARQRIYLSCGEGFVDVIRQRDPDHYERLDRIASRVGARTSYFSAALDRFYLALPARDQEAAEIRVYEPQRY